MCVCVWDASIIFLTLFTFCIFIVASPCASCAAFVAFNQLRRVGQWEEGKGSRRGSSSRRRSRARQRSCLCWTTHKAAAAWMRAPDSKSRGKRETKVSLNKAVGGGGVEGLISPFRGRNLILIELLKS